MSARHLLKYFMELNEGKLTFLQASMALVTLSRRFHLLIMASASAVRCSLRTEETSQGEEICRLKLDLSPKLLAHSRMAQNTFSS